MAGLELAQATVLDGFWRHLEAAPNAIAIATPTALVTYRDLARQAEAIAATIDQETVNSAARATKPVCLLVDHGPGIVAAILGVITAGRFYTPLDVHAPDDRLRGILAFTDADLVICDQAARARAERLGAVRVVVLEEAVRTPPRSFPSPRPDDPAYLLFTSGSTGEPKGVCHTHRSLLWGVMCYAEDSDITPQDRISLIVSCGFTPSLYCIFGALNNGAAVSPFDVRRQPLDAIAPWIDALSISLIFLVPTLFRRIAETLPDGTRLPSLRMIQMAGEPILASDVELYRGHFADHARMYNNMGSAETSCLVRYFIDHDTMLDGGVVPMGYPYDDVEVAIEDEAGRPVPQGEVGELVVTSRYIADGYWQRPDLAVGRFENLPGAPGLRRYRTGDLVRARADGCLVHEGRKDFQIKILGQRVEPAELESLLMGLDGVREAAAVAERDPERGYRLTAYVALAAGHEPDEAELRRALARRAPSALIPTRIVFLAALPTTDSGKLDRLALPAAIPLKPALVRPAASEDVLAGAIAKAYATVLRRDAVAVDDDFFELAGDSLKAVEVCLLVEEICGVGIGASLLAEAPTPGALAAEVRKRLNAPDASGVIHLQVAETRSTPPLFCVSGVGGHVLCYRALARQLGADQEVYGLEFPGLDGQSEPLASIDALAAHFLAQIEQVQPEGPLALAGYSLGGTIVFEMARRLQGQGRRIALLTLIDAHTPWGIRPQPLWRKAGAWARFLRSASGADIRRNLWRRATGQGATLWGREIELDTEFDAILRPMVMVGRGRGVAEACERAVKCHDPRPYDGPVLLFRASRPLPPPRGWLDLYGQWSDLTDGRVETIVVQGGHLDLLTPPAVDLIATTLRERLAAAAAEPPETPRLAS